MQAGQQFRRIPTQQAANLPRLQPPAGYVVVIQDVDYGNRFKIGRAQQIDRDQIRRIADLSIEIRLALILEADNAAGLALDLRDQFVGQGSLDEWFDLDDAQVAQLDEIGRPQAPSLRTLALNEMGAESLVQDAKIVRTTPESPFARRQRSEKRPARRWLAWVILLLIVALGAVVAREAPVIRREIARLVNRPPQRMTVTRPDPDSSPTTITRRATQSPSALPGRGEIFFVRERARARSCASTGCNTIDFLDVGSRIVALRYENGQRVGGDNVWIKFAQGEALLYVHRSVLTRRPPLAAATKVPTIAPTIAATTETTLPPTAKPSATDTAEPTPTATSSATDAATETATATATDTPAPTATYTETVTEVEVEILIVETVNNLNARVRACASINCEILGRLRPGDAVQPLGQVEGQTVNGSAIWIEFEFQGAPAFIHSSLLTRP